MGFYNDIILPRLCDLAMRNKRLLPYRQRVIGAAEGRVLEIGVGSGLNLPFYRASVTEILALEPAPRLVTMAHRASRGTDVSVRFLETSAESIPLDDHSIDTVVTTWTLCSIPRADMALDEMRRPVRTMIETSGFRCDRLETGYMPGPKPMAFIYEGSARPC